MHKADTTKADTTGFFVVGLSVSMCLAPHMSPTICCLSSGAHMKVSLKERDLEKADIVFPEGFHRPCFS